MAFKTLVRMDDISKCKIFYYYANLTVVDYHEMNF